MSRNLNTTAAHSAHAVIVRRVSGGTTGVLLLRTMLKVQGVRFLALLFLWAFVCTVWKPTSKQASGIPVELQILVNEGHLCGYVFQTWRLYIHNVWTIDIVWNYVQFPHLSVKLEALCLGFTLFFWVTDFASKLFFCFFINLTTFLACRLCSVLFLVVSILMCRIHHLLSGSATATNK